MLMTRKKGRRFWIRESERIILKAEGEWIRLGMQ